MKNASLVSCIARVADVLEFSRAQNITLNKTGPLLPRVIQGMNAQLATLILRAQALTERLNNETHVIVVAKAEALVSERETQRKRLFTERRRRHLEMQAEQAAFRQAMSA